MSNGISRANARIYVARIVGGANDPKVLDMADDAILGGSQDWNNSKKWNFLLKDTSLGFTVPSVVLASGNATVSAPSTGAFDGVNTGVTVSGTNITAGTTVSSYTRNADGTLASIVLSIAPTGNGTVTLTFGPDIPIIAGTQEYNAPTDFDEPYGARLLVNRWPLEYVQYREWNRKVNDQTVQGTIELYTVYNPLSFSVQNYRQKRLRVFRIPSQADTMHLQYFRNLVDDADPIDMFQNYLYKFLDYCQWLLLLKKNAHDDRLPQIEAHAQANLQACMTDDEELSDDEETRIKSQMEMGNNARPLWNNGPYYPDFGW